MYLIEILYSLFHQKYNLLLMNPLTYNMKSLMYHLLRIEYQVVLSIIYISL